MKANRMFGLALLMACVMMLAGCGDSGTTTEETADEADGEAAGEEAADQGAPGEEAADEDEAAGEEPAGEAASLTLMLPFQRSLSFWSSMLADELGYFEEENLEVDIQPSGGGTEALQQVIAGNTEMALVAPAVIMQSVAEGNDVVVPYTDKHAGLFSIVVPEGSDIESPEDLEGRTIGITDFAGGEVPMVRAILGRAGLTVDDNVSLVTVGEGNPTTLTALEDGRIDAYGASWSDFIPLMGLGMELREVSYPELSSIPSEVLVMNREYYESNQDVVERVARAMAKASYFVTEDQEATLSLMRDLAPEDHEDPELATLSLDIWLDIADYPEEDGEYVFGQHDPEAWNELEQVLSEHADLSSDVDVDAILDDGVIEAANDFDRDAIRQQAEEMDLSYP